MSDVRQRLREALLSDRADHLWSEDFDATGRDADRIAEFVLREFGIADDSAAYQRVYNAIRRYIDSPVVAAAAAREALEAALSPTEMTQQPEGDSQ